MTIKQYNTILLIVAAGTSQRMGFEIPKPYLKLAPHNIAILTKTILCFQPVAQHIDAIQVVINPKDQAYYHKIRAELEENNLTLPLLPPVFGGSMRTLSVKHGLDAIAPYAPKHVLIHDAARPFVSPSLITNILQALSEHQAVIPATPIHDTIKRIEDNCVTKTIDRTHLYQVQTPQGFDYLTLNKLYQQNFNPNITDEAKLFEQHNIPVFMVKGDTHNKKLTTPDDLIMPDLQNPSISFTPNFRIGSGWDVHKFDKNAMPTNIMLCGTSIPAPHPLLGHSDADVGLHALCDAIYGALAMGDIGQHFPPSESKWRGMPSAHFLCHAHQLLQEQHYRISNIDITFLCEHPKIAPHQQAMRETLSQLLALDLGAISIKATTTETLGFLGRGEGIAAQASILIFKQTP